MGQPRVDENGKLIPLEDRPLTVKQRAWLASYLVCLNGVQAAKEAGYKGNDATLAVVSSENLKKPNIKKLLDEYLEASYGEPLLFLHQIVSGQAKNIQPSGDIVGPTMAQRIDAAKHLVGIKQKLDVDVTVGPKVVIGFEPDEWDKPEVIDVTPELTTD